MTDKEYIKMCNTDNNINSLKSNEKTGLATLIISILILIVFFSVMFLIGKF